MPEAMIRLAPNATVPAAARNLVDRFGAADTVAGSYDVRLVVSEMVSGALHDTEAHVQLIVRRTPDVLRVEVVPAGALGLEASYEEVGLITEIVGSVTDRWGVDRSGSEHFVWCEFAVRDAAQPT